MNLWLVNQKGRRVEPPSLSLLRTVLESVQDCGLLLGKMIVAEASKKRGRD